MAKVYYFPLVVALVWGVASRIATAALLSPGYSKGAPVGFEAYTFRHLSKRGRTPPAYLPREKIQVIYDLERLGRAASETDKIRNVLNKLYKQNPQLMALAEDAVNEFNETDGRKYQTIIRFLNENDHYNTGPTYLHDSAVHWYKKELYVTRPKSFLKFLGEHAEKYGQLFDH